MAQCDRMSTPDQKVLGSNLTDALGKTFEPHLSPRLK